MPRNKRPELQAFSERLRRVIAEQGESQERLAEQLGVKKNSLSNYVNAYNAPDIVFLRNVAQQLGVDLEWLILGEGSPHQGKPLSDDVAESDSGRIVGDVLHDLILDRYPSFDVAAAEMEIPVEDLLACIGPVPAPSWEMLRALVAKLGVNANYLLAGQEPPVQPANELDRVALALGARDDWELALKLEISYEEIKNLRKNGVFPNEWRSRLAMKYGLHPGWVRSGGGPSHVSFEEAQKAWGRPRKSGYYPTVEDSGNPLQRVAEEASDEYNAPGPRKVKKNDSDF